MTTLAYLPLPCSEAVRRLVEALTEAGLEVTRSFDLQTARDALEDPAECPCPYHGTVRCTCQYVVLLVGREGLAPVSLAAHGHDRQTHVALSHPSSEAEPWDKPTELRIREAIAQLAGALSISP
jgi:hypothetical protein